MTGEARVSEGTLRTSDGHALPLESTTFSARAVGPVAEVTVRQVFRNDRPGPIEAVYLFPLAHEASVHRMCFRIGERTVHARVKEKEEARRQYQAARAAGQHASLLEQDRPNLFTLSVANVPPGESIEVELAYQEVLPFDDGEHRLVLPLVAAERYGATVGEGAAAPASPNAVAPPRPRTTERLPDVRIDVLLVPLDGMEAPSSPSHRIDVEPAGDGYAVRLSAADSLPNRDFVLAFRTRGKGVVPTICFEREEGRMGTFLLSVTPPPSRVVTEARPEGRGVVCGNCGAGLERPEEVRDVPGLGLAFRCAYCGVMVTVDEEPAAARAARPRDVVFLVDRSASMRAGSLAQAARAVSLILEKLDDGDAATLYAFGHDVTTFDGDGALRPMSSKLRTDIGTYVAGLGPRGGTELPFALRRVSELPERKNRTRVVVLLTDAALGNEGKLLRDLPGLLGDARLYVLGVGPAVNRYLVAKLARVGGGASAVLLPHEDVEAVVPRFARRVREAGPVLTDVHVELEGGTALELYPSPLPDLFSAQPLRLLGRFRGEGPATLILSGKTARGRVYRQEVPVTLPFAASDVPGLTRLWARHRIESLVDRLARAPQEAADVRLEVLGLALEHSLMSPYTSLVAVDEEGEAEAVPEGGPERVDVALATPGLEHEGPVGVGAAAGPAPAALPATAMMDLSFGGPPPPAMMPGPGAPARPPMTPAPVMAGAPPPPPAPSPPMPAERLAASRASASRARAGGGVFDAIRGFFGGGRSDEPAEPAPAKPKTQPMQRPAGESYSADELALARSRPVGELDLVFVVDETGSMGSYIEQVKARLLELIDALRGSPLCTSLRLGLVSFRDHPPQDTTFVTRVVPLTEDVDAIRQGVLRMQASGGGDVPEALTDGLHELVCLDFRPNAARVAVLVGDAPPHGAGFAGDAFADECPCHHHWFTQAESCRETAIAVHAVHCGAYPGSDIVGDIFRTIARTTGGHYLPLARADLLVPLIANVAESDLDRRRIEEILREVYEQHREQLQRADRQEQVRYLSEVMTASSVRRRTFAWAAGDAAVPPLTFRPVTPADVDDALSRLGLDLEAAE